MAARPLPFARLAGVILAGGASSRMGSNKALLHLDGKPLWQRQLDILETIGASPRWISTAGPVDWLPSAVRAVHDTSSGIGPLSGIYAALDELVHLEQSHLAVLAVDLPGISAAWFEQLWGHCEAGVGSVGYRPSENMFEPLAGIYPAQFHQVAREAVARRAGSLQRLLQDAVETGLIRAIPISAEFETGFANWNRPEDLRL